MKGKKAVRSVGVDVSKKTIDVSYRNSLSVWDHKTFSNDIVGYREMVKVVGRSAHYVMKQPVFIIWDLPFI